MRTILAVASGGALGSVARWVVSRWFDAVVPGFPLGILLANVTGCALIGWFTACTEPGRGWWRTGRLWRQFVVAGCCGGYTTVSSFGLETWELARRGAWAVAGANVGLSLLLTMGAVWAGYRAGSGPRPRFISFG